MWPIFFIFGLRAIPQRKELDAVRRRVDELLAQLGVVLERVDRAQEVGGDGGVNVFCREERKEGLCCDVVL